MPDSWRAPAVMLLCVAVLYVGVRPWLLERFGATAVAATIAAACVTLGLGTAFWHSRHRRYACPACGHAFAASTLRNLASQDWIGRLRARCPACGARDWCDPVPAAPVTADPAPPAPAPPRADAPRSAPGPSQRPSATC